MFKRILRRIVRGVIREGRDLIKDVIREAITDELGTGIQKGDPDYRDRSTPGIAGSAPEIGPRPEMRPPGEPRTGTGRRG